MNYSTLSTTIQTYCENYETDFVAMIPTFVQQTEQRIYNFVQLPAIRSNQTSTLVVNNKYLTLPTTYLSTFSCAVSDPVTNVQTFLINKDVNFIREAYPDPAVSAIPKYYAQFDADTIIMGPTPDQAYGVELHYYAYPTSIVTAGSTWLGNHFDTALLYGSLVEAAVFMKTEQDMITYYKTQFDQALDLLKQLGDGKDRRDTYRSGQLRIDPK